MSNKLKVILALIAVLPGVLSFVSEFADQLYFKEAETAQAKAAEAVNRANLSYELLKQKVDFLESSIHKSSEDQKASVSDIKEIQKLMLQRLVENSLRVPGASTVPVGTTIGSVGRRGGGMGAGGTGAGRASKPPIEVSKEPIEVPVQVKVQKMVLPVSLDKAFDGEKMKME